MKIVGEVEMGGIAMMSGKNVDLKTFVGSCVAVCLFDFNAKVAGMAHVMLPRKEASGKSTTVGMEGKYADEAIANMIDGLVRMGAERTRIRSKIAGGASMFPSRAGGGSIDVGKRNVQAIKGILHEKNIPLISEDTGSNFGRKVIFSLASGKMTITSNFKKLEKVI
ncbi:MAG: chemotaxis protein CheD [Thaumarchaeota archaeon]|nr:chemotaxis protein CheD [Nitrososphaerota archaeon]